jgi:scyllo-inositol 2-dehydrogenase (NADP+)
MTDHINIAIIGAGNISNSRHIPALKTIKQAKIIGVVSDRLERARETSRRHRIAHYAGISRKATKDVFSGIEWFQEVDAVVIGAPPHLHYPLVKAALLEGKHVLVEKPMMMNEQECEELAALAKKKKKLLYVMHNFQYADRMLRLNDIIDSGRYGDVVNITEVQFTNHDRRLPEWYNDLPMGLFYDEAAHFMYLLERHGGKLDINDVHAVYDKNPKAQTPVTLTVNATAGKIPVTMMLNFHSPVCEWFYIVSFKKRILMYDFFKDILIDLPTDNEHLAGDILRNSFSYTWQYWSQFVSNGFKLVAGKLLYGHDRVLSNFVLAIQGEAKPDKYLLAAAGRENVRAINHIITLANPRRR